MPSCHAVTIRLPGVTISVVVHADAAGAARAAEVAAAVQRNEGLVADALRTAAGEPVEAVAAGRPPEPEPVPLPEPADPAPEPGLDTEEAAVADGRTAITMGERIVRAETAGRQARMWLRGTPREAAPIPLAAPLRNRHWVVINGHAGVHGLHDRWAAAEIAGANAPGAICQGFPSLGECRAYIQATGQEVPDRR